MSKLEILTLLEIFRYLQITGTDQVTELSMIKPRMYASYLTPNTDISQTTISQKQMSHNPYGFESTAESETILVLKCRVSITKSKYQNQEKS